MAKAFRTVEMIRGKEVMLRHIVCEIRYSDGQLYLDHCGRVLRKLAREMPEWVVAPEPTSLNTTLHNLLTGTQLGFGRESASLTLNRSTTDEVIDAEQVTEFERQVDAVLGMVLDELEITDFRRIGYREYHYFSFDTKEESESWVQGLGLVTVSGSLLEAFQATTEALGVAIVLLGENCRYRIGLNAVERPALIPVGDAVLNVRPSAAHDRQRQVLMQVLAQKRQRQINSAFAVVLDLDAWLLDPVDPDLPGFVKEQAEAMLPLFKKALPAEPSKKRK